MSTEVPADGVEDPVSTLLDDVVFDMMPSDGFGEALSHLPPESTVAVTLTPEEGIEPTVACAETATSRGFEVVPHVGARFVEDRTHLEAIVERLKAAGVENVFVPGGDRDEPVGDFASAHELLVALEDVGSTFGEVGIAGYPTGHEFIDDETLAEAMAKKAPYATYLVTQLSFDADAIFQWIEDVRERGIDLPVEVGLPGVMDYRRLMTLTRKWGVADPLRFIRKTTGIVGFARKIIGSWGRYRPDELVADLAMHWDDPAYDFHRARLYTFNQTADTETWRRERLVGDAGSQYS